MLLRMALICLFALALAQPLLRVPGFAVLTGESRTVAIVLDDSASMAVVTPEGTLLDRAKRAALAVLDELSSTRGDRATLILAGYRDGGPRRLFDQPTSDLEQVRQLVRGVRQTDLATDLHAAIAAGQEALAGAANQRDLVVISDLQRTGFASGPMADLAPDPQLLFIAVRPSAEAIAQNVSIDAVRYGVARPMRHLPYTIRALITNQGRRATRRTVNLVIGDQVVAQREVRLDPGRNAVVRFVHRFAEPGWTAGRVAFDPAEGDTADALPVDDRRHFSVHVGGTLALLAVNGARSDIPARDELFYLVAALTAGDDGTGRPVVDQTTPDRLQASLLDGYPVVLLANVASLTPAQVGDLERNLDAGGSLLITLGDHVDADVYNRWIGRHRLHGGLLPASLGPRVTDDAFIATIDTDHPTMAPFAGGALGYLSSVRIDTRRTLLLPEDARNHRVLMRSSKGDPILIEKRFGKGRVILFASSVDRDWTGFPLHPAYVPSVHRWVAHLARPAIARGGFVRTGQAITLAASITHAQAHRVHGPDGSVTFPVAAADPESSVLRVTATDVAGAYRVLRTDAGPDDDTTALLFAANVPHRESQLAALDEAAIRDRVGDALVAFLAGDDALRQRMLTARTGGGLWEPLLLAALLACLIEPWIANRLAWRAGNRAERQHEHRPTARAPRREVA